MAPLISVSLCLPLACEGARSRQHNHFYQVASHPFRGCGYPRQRVKLRLGVLCLGHVAVIIATAKPCRQQLINYETRTIGPNNEFYYTVIKAGLQGGINCECIYLTEEMCFVAVNIVVESYYLLQNQNGIDIQASVS